MAQVWCNGVWCDSSAIPVAATDRGLLHGFGLFETLLAIDGRPVFSDRHLDRLRRSCQRLGWEFPGADLGALAGEALERNSLGTGRARIRVTLTAGSGEPGDGRAGDDRLLMVSASPAADPPGSVTVTVSPWRPDERSPLAGLKCSSYAERLAALSQARAGGFDDVLFFNGSGHLCEASLANVFLVTGGILFTPSLETGCLPGVTREVVLESAAELRIPIRECLLTPRDLRGAGEVFLTSAVRGVVPVSRVGERVPGPAPVAARLRDSWAGAVRR